MAPAQQSPSTTPNAGVVVIIICSIVGGVALALIAAAIIIIPIRRRRQRTKSQAHRAATLEPYNVAAEPSPDRRRSSFSYETVPSETLTLAPLLDTKPRWPEPEWAGQRLSISTPYQPRDTRYDGFEDYHESTYYVPVSAATPLMQESTTPTEAIGRAHLRIYIPVSTTAQYVSTNPIATVDAISSASAPPSAASESSESLYSQPSASLTHAPYTLPTTYPSPSPPPDYAIARNNHEREEEKQPLTRMSTRAIGHMLKVRARRAPGPPARTFSAASHIERANSIRSVDDDDVPEVRPPQRPKRARTSKAPPLSMAPLMEASDSSASTDSAARQRPPQHEELLTYAFRGGPGSEAVSSPNRYPSISTSHMQEGESGERTRALLRHAGGVGTMPETRQQDSLPSVRGRVGVRA